MISKRVASNATSVTRCIHRPVPRVITPRTRKPAQSVRFQSTNANSSGSSTGSPAFVGALTGSLATATIGYIWYRQSGAQELLAATKTTKDYVNSASRKLKESAPEPNEALDWLRDTAKSYAVFIPGASGYIDTAFKDLDAIRAKHGQEVDNIVREAYSELQDIAKKGTVSIHTAQEAWSVIVKHLGRIADLSGDAVQQIMDNHPHLKESVGGNVDKLKEYGRNYGPEAKKEVDRTWSQISDIIKTGVNSENIEKIRKVVQEKVDKLKQLGDQAWKKGMEQAKPYLDKNPTVKKLVEENADTLKQGDAQELYQKIKSAVESGSTDDLESYVNSAINKAKGTGLSSLDHYLNKVPGGDQIIPKLQQIQEVAQNHGDEAQKIMKEAVNEISEILKKKGNEAEELVKKAKKDAKK